MSGNTTAQIIQSSEPIKTAPRDGRYIMVWAEDDGVIGGPYRMRWDSEFRNGLVGTHKGMWVADGDHFTWDESRGAGPEFWSEIS